MPAPTCLDLSQQTEDYLKTAPNPEAMEEKTEILREGLAGLGARSLLALNVPPPWSETEVSQLDYFRVLERLARYSGTLNFTQTQHQSAGSFIANGDNERLKSHYLPKMRSGQILVGVSYAHLRREKPTLTATKVQGGYLLSGYLPWITGWNLFQEAVVAARLEDERIIFALIPFVTSAKGELRFSAPMSLAAMSSTNTVSAECDRYFVPDETVISLQSKDWIEEKTRQNVLNPTFSLLGLARSGLDIVENASKAQASIAPQFLALSEQLEHLRTKIYTEKEEQQLSLEQQLQLRAQAIALTHQCSLATIMVSRGSANQKHHPAQRIHREALVLSVMGHTNKVMETTLEQIVNQGNI
ncbi:MULTISPECIES: acyl-CoA dehydrogenase family protein [unclassified Roseofilum]|uniref:acyl-CoA dehydrogenase family protein n=1 Tax=unclassified Roseofilum TaxID=2620099 RepID=UPI000E8609A6|nr:MULTISPECIES: acyl-CoA dehydrogenase family protein [unclassified Roseofilum]HBR00316.1 acyl-CoA dehydrogenase [Cyanobacteria bacterium UBA11691]MBP0010373.1 acyl-CoA/acyl-ACP dehydrogenase [Roseofilum sp. Belize Diploria]MBP0012037.1 acyl-CoA/acyl-ACP dehydrogenase [Roseofilum sp. SID3]MBP0026156.1 acyl-CoA/acyl-ACP dehydrogenase [Roseofilum sp. SID2]MBP0034703.1 acyl-CoA/acyl-ACP dehydrogenase [Roseofilum sp. Belize BBD 4]